MKAKKLVKVTPSQQNQSAQMKLTGRGSVPKVGSISKVITHRDLLSTSSKTNHIFALVIHFIDDLRNTSTVAVI